MLASNPSRLELLNWVSEMTKTTVQKLDQLSDGIQFCQLFDKIYPKTINLHKVKREPKVQPDKQKNFRLLQDAIVQMELPIKFDISELSSAKCGPLLNLLQLLYKEHKKPSKDSTKGGSKQHLMSQPKMIKSYVGNLVYRGQSCQKEKSLRSKEKSICRGSNKSLDLKNNLSDQTQIQPVKSEKKGLQKSCKKVLVSVDDEVLKKTCERKKSEMKEMRTQKKNDQTLEKLFKDMEKKDKEQVQIKLIRVTEAILETNPELKSKIEEALGQTSNNPEYSHQTFQQDESKIVHHQGKDTDQLEVELEQSNQCKTVFFPTLESQKNKVQDQDTAQDDVQDRIKNNQEAFQSKKTESNLNLQNWMKSATKSQHNQSQSAPVDINQNNGQFPEKISRNVIEIYPTVQNQAQNESIEEQKNDLVSGKKSTVKKTSMKSLKSNSKPSNSMVLSTRVIEKVSAKKQNEPAYFQETEIQRIHLDQTNKISLQQALKISQKSLKKSIQDPESVPKPVQMYHTMKKVEGMQEDDMNAENKRLIQSEPAAKVFDKRAEDVWANQQNQPKRNQNPFQRQLQ